MFDGSVVFWGESVHTLHTIPYNMFLQYVKINEWGEISHEHPACSKYNYWFSTWKPFALNWEWEIAGDFKFFRDAEQGSSVTSICFLLWTASNLKAGQPASVATDMHFYGVTLLWLCIGNKDIPLKLNWTPDLKRIDVDGKAKGLLSNLLCCGDCMKAKPIKAQDYFLIARSDINPMPEKDSKLDVNALLL